jgi:hypothetical protein
MQTMKTLVLRLLMLYALLLAASARAEVVNVYTSANFAPLMLADGRGVYPDLIAHLNRKKPGGLTFRLQFMPRKRLQVKLEEGSLDGLVIGLMPEWLADREQKKYLWTEPFATDRFALVSLSKKPVDPQSRATRPGRTVGITTGYVYPGLDDWFFRSGLQRSGGVSDEKNIERLLRKAAAWPRRLRDRVRIDGTLLHPHAQAGHEATRRFDARPRHRKALFGAAQAGRRVRAPGASGEKTARRSRVAAYRSGVRISPHRRRCTLAPNPSSSLTSSPRRRTAVRNKIVDTNCPTRCNASESHGIVHINSRNQRRPRGSGDDVKFCRLSFYFPISVAVPCPTEGLPTSRKLFRTAVRAGRDP